MRAPLFAVLAVARAGSAAEAVGQTFEAPADRVWAVTEALLKPFPADLGTSR